ncbi:hypothetical protein TWF594_007097 [Orbilia oligospora]|nr:hypothetical protein TWF594_007097 [Orbilia oligospora]
MKRRRILPAVLLFMELQFSQVTQCSILGFQLSSDPVITLKMYLYLDGNPDRVDLTNCQEGPGGEVLAVGVINGVKQGIGANTRRKMRAIALWREPDCLATTPDYIISWRGGIQGMQLADMALAGQVINVRSWMDLQEKNTHLRRLGQPFGYIYKFGGNGAGPDEGEEGERIYVEEGMPMVTTGIEETPAAAKLELIQRAGAIRKAFLTMDEIDDDGDDDDNGNHGNGYAEDVNQYQSNPQPEGTSYTQTNGAHDGWQHAGSEQRQRELNAMVNTNLQDRILMGQNPSQNVMSNPFMRPLHLPQQPQNNIPFDSSMQLTSYLANPLIYTQQGFPSVNANAKGRQLLEEAVSRFGYELGLLNPMAPVEEVERRTEMLKKYLSDANEETVPDMVNNWPTVGIDPNSISPELLEDVQVKNEGEGLTKEEGQSNQVNNQIVEEVQMSRNDPMQGPGFDMAYRDNTPIDGNLWDPQLFGSNPYIARWQPLIPEPMYHGRYYNPHDQALENQQRSHQSLANGERMLGMQEDYPRMLSEIYNTQAYGGQVDEPDAGIQLAGYGQDFVPDNNEAFPNDLYQEPQLGRVGRGRGGNPSLNDDQYIQSGDEIVPDQQLFEEEYSPLDDGDFLADDENSGGTRLSEF